MLRKKDSFTIITPIPGFIPRQLAIDILHSHSEVITLNPLVLEHKPIAAPQNAETDEYYSTWYEITERITFMPGIGKMGASIIKFNGCFHDMPWGLQTHIYAPMNVDLRNTYRIAGNQPGFEPPEVPEIGLKALGVPSDGLYLREDIEIKCNMTVIGFVKSQLKKAGGEMVQRIIKKAELLDAGVLSAMIQDGKLKTVNPADRRNTLRSPVPSPLNLRHSPSLSGTPPPGSASPSLPYQIPRPNSTSINKHGYRPNSPNVHTSGSQAAAYGYGAPATAPTQPGAFEMPAAEVHPQNHFAAEMPGDYYYSNSNAPPPKPAPQSHSRDSATYRDSNYSTTQSQYQPSPDPSQSGQWSQAGSRPTSMSSVGTGGGYQSPGLDKSFSSQLSPHKETSEEHKEHREEALRKLDPRIPHPSHYPPYNPADYAKVSPAKQAQYGHGQLTERYHYTQQRG